MPVFLGLLEEQEDNFFCQLAGIHFHLFENQKIHIEDNLGIQ